MLYYPLNPDKSFVKRVIAEEGDTVRIVDGRVYVNDIPLRDDYVPAKYRSHDDWGPGAWCPSGTSSARFSFGGGRYRRRECSRLVACD